MGVPVVTPSNTPERMRTCIAFLALAGELGGAGAAPVDVGLQVGFAQRQTRRAAIDHTAQCRPMALAKARHHEGLAETVTGHRRTSTSNSCAQLRSRQQEHTATTALE